MEPSHLNKVMLAFKLLRREATPMGDVAKDTLMLRIAMLKDTPVQATMGYGGGKPGGRSPNSRSNIPKPEPKVWKWRVRFDGSRDFNAEQFVERVEELAGADGELLEKLLQQMVKLLEGKALTWFRSESGNFESWSGFKTAFRETFLPPGYDHQLFDLIRSLRQEEDDTFEMYLAAMNALFRRLDRKLSPGDRLRIVSKNISKFLRRSHLMQEYRSVGELLTLAK
ncbi:hypothetical protein GE061_016769 [Apolygus lucorum]|uniref:Retrotransposon gag domain-containing protein n=1 Tax=Apolygus lucorum TaxID=248454 RepID=A0A8S9XL56_APOLU|nr:hypothetical protein GE061_016769 [Apolygus lucorum]